MATVLAAIGDRDEVTLVKSEGEPSSSAKRECTYIVINFNLVSK